MPGQILGDRYEVEQQLGKKDGRWTLLARDLETEAPVILKLLFIDDQMHENDLKLFTREVQILQTLNHPAAPRYLGYFEIDLARDGKALALIQTYLDGTSLEQYLSKGRLLNEKEAMLLAKEVLKILVYLHDHTPPIIHRDIKPSNILLKGRSDDAEARISLVDFGSVKSLTSAEGSFTLVGTDGYMPPEQLGRRAIRSSDLFSLGMTLIHGMTGIIPEEMPRRGLRVDLSQIPALQPCTELWLNWLKRMTEPELEQRFTTAQDALDALRSIYTNLKDPDLSA